MAASSKVMIGEAERRFPVRIKVALPAGGFGTRLTTINAWLDANCGADEWAMTPAGLRGVLNDSVAIYFLDVATAAGFVARWCATSKMQVADGAFQMRRDDPILRVPLKPTRRHSGAHNADLRCPRLLEHVVRQVDGRGGWRSRWRAEGATFGGAPSRGGAFFMAYATVIS